MKDKAIIDIATYGISLFDEKHEYGPDCIYYSESQAQAFVRKVAQYGFDTRLLVGIPAVRKVKSNGFGLSEVQHIEKIREVLGIGERYGIKALPTTGSHLKMYRINNLYVVGGINLTNSYWADSAVVLENQEDKIQMQGIFDDMWRGATIIHPLTPACRLLGDNNDCRD